MTVPAGLAVAYDPFEGALRLVPADADGTPALGPKARKKRQRKLLFGGLRAGLTRPAACALAGVEWETFSAWMGRASFARAVVRAESDAAADLG